MKIFRLKRWSPWAAGALTGFAAALCAALAGRVMGASGGYESIVSMCVTGLNLDLAKSVYFTRVKPPVPDFQTIQFLGILLGAFLAAVLSGDFKIRSMPDREWTDNFGHSRPKRWGMLFVGCMLLEIGAGIAGGCTSGLGISGTMLLSPAGLLFIAGVFPAGIVATKILYGRRYR